MPIRRSRLDTRTAQWLVCCCLLVAVPLCGLTALLSSVIGSVHFHKAAVAVAQGGPMAGWNDFRRADHATDSAIRLHDHSKLGRHHHDAHDASLVTVGAGEHDDGVDGAASVTGAIVLAASDPVSLRLPAPAAVRVAWVRSGACSFQSCVPSRLDRPPIGAA